MWRAASSIRSAHPLRCLNCPVDGVSDPDEDPCARRERAGDDRQNSAGIGFAGELDVEVADPEPEQPGKQPGVVDVEAVCRVLVTARAGMYADPGAFSFVEALQDLVVQRDELFQEMPARVELQ